jgi:hypothetical protein
LFSWHDVFLLAHFPGDTLLQHLQYRRRRALLGLADQQMHMVQHQRVPHEKKSVLFSNLAEFFQKKVSRTRRTQQWKAAVTTEK